jgi:hypothetical protein
VANAQHARQNHLLLLPPDNLSILLLCEQLHHHLIVIVHRGNPMSTLWAGRTEDLADHILLSTSFEVEVP